ncbi:SPOR domain-containing protein [Cohnella thailandensis]|uniref:SPOR domain-containing protein n=1 Tax=Cohnella thailandensis TaxID=557557 RepID=A0A841SPM0_9BACL|nr:SPOR domain-containing protein [Cohnella thailandensis]MBB6633904.1 SPOR domain-containing protein [Cohnella thailandensis]MBP1972587.1 hypothetical protein [Cohnella thailandensis]
MQPKARMTFRFDNANAAPAPVEPTVQGQGNPPQALKGNAVLPAGEAPNAEPNLKQAQGKTVRPEKRTKTDYQAWHSPYQDDIHALEEMIRTTEREAVTGFSGKPVQRQSQQSSPSPEQKPGDERERKRGSEPAYEPIARQVPLKNKGSRKGDFAKRGETIPFPKAYQGRQADYSDTESPGPIELPEPPEPPDPFDDASYEWIDDRNGRNVYRENGPSWMRVFVTVVGAIATGGLFGYLLLTLFTGEPLLPSQGAQNSPGVVASGGELPAVAPLESTERTSGAKAGQGQETSGGTSETGGAGEAQTSGQAANATATVPSVTMYVLQHGVFRSEESMEEAAEKLRAQGIAAATDTTDGYRVYAGISPTKAEADEMVSMLSGTEVYVKALNSATFPIAGIEDVGEYVGFLSASADLYGKIAGFASESLNGKLPSEDNDILSIRTAHQNWLEQAKAASSWIDSAKTSAQAEIEQLNAAVNALNSYSEKPEKALLWKAQTAAMNAVFADRQLRSFIQLQAGG